MKKRYRLLAIAVLVVLGIGANVQFGSTQCRSYPEPADIMTDPAGTAGEKAFLFVEVERIDEQAGEMTVLLEEKAVTAVGFGGVTTVVTDRHELTVQSVDPAVLQSVEPGSSIQVYGTLRAASTVLVAENTVIDYRDGGDWSYTFGASILGAILAAGYFLYYWRPSWRSLCFEKRGGS
jgi:hypothetical protein